MMCDIEEYKSYAGLQPKGRKMRERLDLNFAMLFLLKLPSEGSIVQTREIILSWVLGSSKPATQPIYFRKIKIKIIKKGKLPFSVLAYFQFSTFVSGDYLFIRVLQIVGAVPQ